MLRSHGSLPYLPCSNMAPAASLPSTVVAVGASMADGYEAEAAPTYSESHAAVSPFRWASRRSRSRLRSCADSACLCRRRATTAQALRLSSAIVRLTLRTHAARPEPRPLNRLGILSFAKAPKSASGNASLCTAVVSLQLFAALTAAPSAACQSVPDGGRELNALCNAARV